MHHAKDGSRSSYQSHMHVQGLLKPHHHTYECFYYFIKFELRSSLLLSTLQLAALIPGLPFVDSLKERHNSLITIQWDPRHILTADQCFQESGFKVQRMISDYTLIVFHPLATVQSFLCSSLTASHLASHPAHKISLCHEQQLWLHSANLKYLLSTRKTGTIYQHLWQQ